MAYLYKVSHVGLTIAAALAGSDPRMLTIFRQGMAALGSGSDISGSVLLTWHEKVSVSIIYIVLDVETFRSLQKSLVWAALCE